MLGGVRPIAKAGLVAALLAALSVTLARSARTVRVGAKATPSATLPGAGFSAVCPRGTLPDGNVCVPVPPGPTAKPGAVGPAETP
jgi:hypothetical protein